MSNIPQKDLEKSFEISPPSLSAEELAVKIHDATKFEKRLWRFQWCVKKPDDIKGMWLFLCSFLLQENIHPDIISLLIEHSKQNGFEDWIDLNKDIMDWQHILDYAIRHDNYNVFKKLIALNANYLSHNSLHASTSCRSQANAFDENEVRIKKMMTSDLLELWAPVKKETIESVIRFSDASFLQIIADSEQWKKLMTAKFLKAQLEDASNQHFLKNRPEIQTTLMMLYNKQKVIETIQEDGWKDEVEKAVSVLRGGIKQEITDIITSPTFLADIIEEIYKENEVVINGTVIKWIKKKIIWNPGRIIEKLMEQ
ncbi:MAG: hypothetical protein ACD_3C00225G0008 [uncultured bacterium (gcode 4)]|uniref:Uncharacterized protein n=1 Tax=uncultured bacterium (gcode 4) TaxID=1234023 RepID=K2GVF5_9BACT|nr:MAG: hypothetical protein ACD_3C00225G0008 [uncultured bacterium (gcode 4)]